MAEQQSNSRSLVQQLRSLSGEIIEAINKAEHGSTGNAASTSHASVDSELHSIFTQIEPTTFCTRSDSVDKPSTSTRTCSINNSLTCETPTFRFQKNFSSKKRKQTKGKGFAYQCGPFIRTCVLLGSPYCEQVPRQDNKLTLSSNGHIISGVLFQKQWSEYEIYDHISAIYAEKLCGAGFEVVTSLHTALVTPKLAVGQTLNGVLLNKLTKDKPIYIRPKVTLIEEDPSECIEHELNEKDDMPRLSKKRPRRTSTNSFNLANILSFDKTDTTINLSKHEDSRESCSVLDLRDENPLLHTQSDLSSKNEYLHESPVHISLPLHLSFMPESCSSAIHSPLENKEAQTTSQQQEQSATKVIDKTYADYLNLLDSSDNEEIEEDMLQYAKEQSLLDSGCKTDKTDIAVLLKDYQNTYLIPDMFFDIIIHRRHVLKSTIRAVNDSNFCFFHTVLVNFSGEDAQDGGGPRREFFRLLVHSVCSEMGIFEGPPACRSFGYDIQMVASGKYFLAGKLIAWSLLQGGPGPNCLSKDVYSLFTEGDAVNVKRVLDDGNIITDEKVCEAVRALMDTESDETWKKAISHHGEILADQGLPMIFNSKYLEKVDICKLAVKQFLFYRVKPAMDQFKEGLDSVGKLWTDYISLSPDAFRDVFLDMQDPITYRTFKELCTVQRSVKGSNAYEREDDTLYSWELFIQMLEKNESDQNLQSLLVFITGADKIPPLGFPNKISVKFYDNETSQVRYPWVSTCALEINLPRGYDKPEAFEDLMMSSIRESHGFGKL